MRDQQVAPPREENVTDQARRVLDAKQALDEWTQRREGDEVIAKQRDRVADLHEGLAAEKALLEQLRGDWEHSWKLHDAEEELDVQKTMFLATWDRSEKRRKTFQWDDGGVQVRESKGLDIQSHEELARALIERDLWDAAAAEVKVDKKFVFPLAAKGALPGVEATVVPSIAYLKAKDTMQYGGGSGPC